MTSDGEYIVQRFLPDFVRAACDVQGIEYESFSDDWMLRLERDGKRQWVIGYTFSLNPASSVGLTSDKVASYQALTADDIPAVEHYLARSRASSSVLMENLQDIKPDQPVLIKPLEGTSGHGIHLFSDLSKAVEHLTNQSHTDWSISPWYDIVCETRLIICQDRLLCCYEKQHPIEQDGLLFYNLGMGARAVETAPSPEILQLALKATRSIGLGLAAVDIATLADGSTRVLEVNGGIMMEHYARQSDEYKNRAREVYGAIINKMFE